MDTLRDITTVVLCGGQGTRLRAITSRDTDSQENVPKPLVEIGGKPILWHILQLYAAQGCRRFVLCLGYRGDLIRQTLPLDPAWDVTFAETGELTPTGGRVLAVADQVSGSDFFVTYGDGLADLDLAALLAFHRRHGNVATLTAVRPRLPFGLLRLAADGRVRGFQEKPQLEQWINGGFFVFQRAIFERLRPDVALEAAPLETLAAEGQLHAFQHRGFWACMDTYKDQLMLNQLWEAQAAAWKIW